MVLQYNRTFIVCGIEGALRMVGNVPVLILADSRAALQAIKVAGAVGRARTRGLGEVLRLIFELENECGEKSVSLACVKAHVGISGNEEADTVAKEAAQAGGGRAVTEGGIRAWVKEMRKEERVVKGFGVGRVVRWKSRYAVSAYSQLRTGKGLLGAWLKKIGKAESGDCVRCGVEGSGTHEAFGCMAGEAWGRRWSTWGQMDEKVRWRRVEKGPDEKEVVIDLVEEWCDRWWREAGGRVRLGEG